MATSEWRPAKLDQLGHVGRGRSRHRPRNADFLYDGPYPFFQTGDIKAANYYLNDYSQTYSEAGLAQSKLWQPGTLCITIAANIAESAILGIEGCFPDSVVGFVADPEKADVRFVKYYLEILKLRMQSISHGATQDNLSLDKLLTFDFLVPPLPIQRRIAGILSAYDDLIENSQRRIKILEEMARRLYREWFINGQASTAWPAEQLGHLFELKRGYDLPARDRRPGLFPIVSSSGITGFHEAFMARGPGIVTGRYGTLGEVHLVWDEFWPLNTSLYVKDFKGTPFLYVFWLLRHVLPDQKGSAAAVPGINRNDLHSLLINSPPLSVMQDFHNLCLPLANQARFLAESIQNLRRTRDLLLPCLLSGQIDVDILSEPPDADQDACKY